MKRSLIAAALLIVVFCLCACGSAQKGIEERSAALEKDLEQYWHTSNVKLQKTAETENCLLGVFTADGELLGRCLFVNNGGELEHYESGLSSAWRYRANVSVINGESYLTLVGRKTGEESRATIRLECRNDDESEAHTLDIEFALPDNEEYYALYQKLDDQYSYPYSLSGSVVFS